MPESRFDCPLQIADGHHIDGNAKRLSSFITNRNRLCGGNKTIIRKE